MEKECTNCGQVKNINEFGKDRHRKDGLNSYCKICVNDISRKWAQDNPEKRRASVKKWDDAHPENNRRKALAYYHRHPEKANKWLKEHPEKRLEVTHKTRAKFPEKYKARSVVNNAILMGKLQPAKSFICHNCNVNQASQYHHWHGYKPEHWLDVIPLCPACHKD